MSVDWFSTVRTITGAVASKECRITITRKPKGIRFNVAMTRELSAVGKSYMRIGHDDDQRLLLIQPTDEADESFKMVTSKSGGQLSNAAIWRWASENNLDGVRLTGGWDEEQKAFMFQY